MLGILAWFSSATGRHSAAERPQMPGHRGADPEYVVKLKEINRKLRKAKAEAAGEPVVEAVASVEPDTEFVEPDALALTELALRTRQMDRHTAAAQPRRRRVEDKPLTGEFTQCPGCRHLGCVGDCPELAARKRAAFVTDFQAAVLIARAATNNPVGEEDVAR